MKTNFIKNLNKKYQKHIYTSMAIKEKFSCITNSNNFQIGKITEKKQLQIFTSAYNMPALRRFENEFNKYGPKFGFNSIIWRAQEMPEKIQKRKIKRQFPKKIQVPEVKHESLNRALKNLRQTISRNSQQ